MEAFRDELTGDFEDLCIVMVTDDLIFDVKTFRHFIEVYSSNSESRSLIKPPFFLILGQQ